MVRIEIIFHTAGRPKVHDNVYSLYTKGDFLCVHLEDDLIMKYPLNNIFSVAHYHADHLGTTRGKKEGI